MERRTCYILKRVKSTSTNRKKSKDKKKSSLAAINYMKASRGSGEVLERMEGRDP